MDTIRGEIDQLNETDEVGQVNQVAEEKAEPIEGATVSPTKTEEDEGDDEGGMVTAEESFDGNDEDEDEGEYGSDEEDDMPLLKYSRMAGSVPRVGMSSAVPVSSNILSGVLTCTKMSRVILPAEDVSDMVQRNSQQPASLGQKQPAHVLALGFANGDLIFVDAQNGETVLSAQQLQIQEKGESFPVVDITLDAAGNTLAAINDHGLVCIWELKYTRSDQPQQSQDVFSNFLSSLSGPAPPTVSNDASANDAGIKLNCSILQASRVSFPSSFQLPTCMVLDPSYRRRREKAMLVGFRDGKLILTKRGFMFQRRTDAVIYQGAGEGSGIEAVEWRGSLVAWADASGIKLFDVESMTRIAHIDRPSGANAALYPSISSLKPTLLFETSEQLLVAWGDCVMMMKVKDVSIVQKAPDVAGTSSVMALPPSADTAVLKKRQVECTMAWELDCVASGVVPLDKDHVIILGLIPNEEDNEASANDLEVQVISRAEGTIVYADVLPVIKLPSQFTTSPQGAIAESASPYFIGSTFGLPRMEDSIEAEEEGVDQDFDFTLAFTQTKAKFTDPHLKWDMQAISFATKKIDTSRKSEKKASLVEEKENAETDGAGIVIMEGEDDGHDDTSSVDSDDYDFLFRPIESESEAQEAPAMATAAKDAPAMIIACPTDIIQTRVRNIDDACAHALGLERKGRALELAIRHRRGLRNYDLDDLIDEYLRAVLRITLDSNTKSKALSIRRLELAAKATPILLGGDIDHWRFWIEEFTRIPGALFILSGHLPVRDPRLPPVLYQKVLTQLLIEAHEMENNKEVIGNLAVPEVAADRFLSSLSGWGSTHALREKIQFHEYQLEQVRKKNTNEVVVNPHLDKAKALLQNRLTQTAAVYLQLPRSKVQPNATDESGNDVLVDSTTDTLYGFDKVHEKISELVSVVGEWPPPESSENTLQHQDTKVGLMALGELNIISTSYEMALRCYLAVGSLFPSQPLNKLQKEAIEIVNSSTREKEYKIVSECTQCGFVLGMIEHHHLHGCLVDPDFLPRPDANTGLLSPLISLICLVGLDLIGDFLVEHCVPPPSGTRYGSSESLKTKTSEETENSRVKEGIESLPINLVADQLESSPPLLHWYLHTIFTRKPEMYVSFPHTAVPPRAVTDLHRKHLDLHLTYAEDKDSARSLIGTEIYNLARKTTPFLSFLKAALPLGGIRPFEVRNRILEVQRSDVSAEDSYHAFALELAYVIEVFGSETEEDAKKVLDLYLRGVNSVMLAASYAQRNTKHSSMLWDILIKHCLESKADILEESTERKTQGILFGTLLESAALCGADLALLVTRIPEGMNIEGLRPRLVAAVGDYRLKLQMHKAAAQAGTEEKIDLLRQVGHRSRRGTRHGGFVAIEETKESASPKKVPHQFDPTDAILRRPKHRPNRYRLAVKLPMR